MSYPSPYQPPQNANVNFDYYQQADPLAPARRAGALMYVMGALVLLSSVCCGGMGALFPRIIEQQPDIMNEMREVPGATPQLLQGVFIGMGVFMLLVAAVYFILARFVRGGSKGAIVTSIVLSLFGIVVLLLLLVMSGVQLATGKSAAAFNLCTIVVPLALLGLQSAWLFQAMRGADRAMASQYAMQYWQYAQQQQAYAQQQQQYQQPPPPPSSPPPQ